MRSARGRERGVGVCTRRCRRLIRGLGGGFQWEERSEESGEGECERVDVPHDEGFGEGGREMRESHGLGRMFEIV